MRGFVWLSFWFCCCVVGWGVVPGRFACRARGHVQGLIVEFVRVGEVSRSDHAGRAQLLGLVGGARVLGGRRILVGVIRVRPHRKNPAHLAGCGRDGSSQSRPTVWKRLRISKVPRLHQGDEAHEPLDRVGVGWGNWGCMGPRLQALHEQG